MDRLSFRKQTDAAGFTMLSNLVLLDTQLTDGAKVTYLVLLYHARTATACFPGQGKLAEERGVSDRSVRSHLKELAERGLVTVERRGRAKTNLYWIEPLEEIYGKESSDQAHDRKIPSAGDRKPTSVPTTFLKNTHTEEDSGTLNVPGSAYMQLSMAAPVAEILELTGDAGSERRFRQLHDIAVEAGWGSSWDEAVRSLKKRVADRGRPPLDRPGAYFCQTLTAILTRRGVAVPTGTPQERRRVRSEIATSLAAGLEPE